MKFIWVSLIVSLINVSRAKTLSNIFLENKNINSDVSKVSVLPTRILVKRQTIGLFPKLPNSGNKSMVNLKPPVNTYSQANQFELCKKPLMRKLSINNLNDTDNDRLKAEVTTKRSLMQAMKFTVKPHDIYAESIREKYNWNNKRKMNTYKSKIPKIGSNIAKTNSKAVKDESRFLNNKNVTMSLNDNNNNLYENLDSKNRYVASGTPKPKTTLLFPKRNYTKYLKGNSEQRVSKRRQINNVVYVSEMPSIVVNNGIIVLVMEFPNMLDSGNNFVVNLNPTIKSIRQLELEKYRSPFMNKLLLKDINNKVNVKVTDEVTTRRSLMQRKIFTARPHNVYANTINKKYNWNRNNSTYNLEKPKIETNSTKEKFQQGSEKKSSEKETQNLNRGNTSINNPDFANIEKEHINNRKHTYDYVGLRKSKTLLLFPRRNYLNYSKENTPQSESQNKTSSIVNDQNSNIVNVTIYEDKENSTINPEVIIKSDSKNQIEAVKEPKENTSDEEKKDREEFIHVTEVNQNVESNAKHNVSDNNGKTIGQRFRFYSFWKNKIHIVEVKLQRTTGKTNFKLKFYGLIDNVDSKDQMDEIIETNENFFGQDEFISVREVNENKLVEPNFKDDVEITTVSNIEYLVSRPKRGVNIIEEESIATTFSGMKITSQEYPLSHDLTFKNIHT